MKNREASQFLLFQFCFQKHILSETHIIMNIISRKSHIYIIYLIFIVFFSSATVTAGPPGALVGIVEAWRRGFR